jgi:hypothetical protein
MAGTSHWSRAGRETGSIAWNCDGVALWLDYAVTPLGGGEKRIESPGVV